MQKQNILEEEYFLEITNLFSKLLGINNLVFQGPNGAATYPVSGLTGKNYIETQQNIVLINSMKNLVNVHFNEYISLKNTLDKKHLLQKITDEFIYGTILFPQDAAKNELLNNNNLLVEGISNFFGFLQDLAVKAYEQRVCTASFIVSKLKNSVRIMPKILNDWGLDFFPVENGQIEYEAIYDYSKAYRLVDSLSLSYVTDENFKIIGLARKRKDYSSIKETFFNYCPDEIDFVYLENKSINWINSKDVLLHFQNGQWKIKDYEMINGIVQYCLTQSKCEEIRAYIYIFVEVFKSLSQENIGSLFVFIDEACSQKHNPAINGDEYIPYDLECLLERLLNNTKNDNLEIVQLFKQVIADCRAITEIDKYLLKLIASVDGAVIVDNKLNIVDYGRMIKTQELNEQFKNFYLPVNPSAPSTSEGYKAYDLENPPECNVNGGARSLAACNASTFGTAVKISEDGGIDIYYHRILVYSI